jgi:hypothetical protein
MVLGGAVGLLSSTMRSFGASCSLILVSACTSTVGGGGACGPGDSDGVTGGNVTIDLTVSDTAFSVGAPDSGSTQRNITTQNLAAVTLTMTNVGTRPHDFVVQCLATPNGTGCPTQSCFPANADLPALAPGATATTTFVTPAAEGGYTFVSNEPGDTQASAGSAVTGLVGRFNVM